jgi:hypothetical protein
MHHDRFPEGSHRSGARSGQPSSGSCATATSARPPTGRGKDAHSDAALCLYDKSLRRVRSWRARLGDELPEGLVIDSIVEAEEAADACRDVAPVPGGEHALHTTRTTMSSTTID